MPTPSVLACGCARCPSHTWAAPTWEGKGTGYRSLVTGHGSLVAGHWSRVAGPARFFRMPACSPASRGWARASRDAPGGRVLDSGCDSQAVGWLRSQLARAQGAQMANLIIGQTSFELIGALRPLMARIKKQDRALADQLARSASSIALMSPRPTIRMAVTSARGSSRRRVARTRRGPRCGSRRNGAISRRRKPRRPLLCLAESLARSGSSLIAE
jgi:hypothetical protein